jgi:ankyrin repeat protein
VDEAEELFVALKSNDVAKVRALLDRSPALAASAAPDGTSAILTAAYHRATDVLSLLVSRAPPLSIFEAAAVGDCRRLEALLEPDPGAALCYSHDGWTALHLTAFFSRTEAARLLLGRKADPSAVSRNPMANQPLHAAAAAGGADVGLVSALLDAGADPNARQRGGFRPLHSAAANGDAALVQLLLARGADRSAATDDGRTPLQVARERGHARVEALLA